MLVLGRHKGQKVQIGADITIEITHVNLQTGLVKLGFVAPEDVIIDREEVSERRRVNPWPTPKYKDLG